MKLDYSKLDGLLPAVVQDAATGRVLMVGFMNDAAFQKTVETGPSNKRPWKLVRKGSHGPLSGPR